MNFSNTELKRVSIAQCVLFSLTVFSYGLLLISLYKSTEFYRLGEHIAFVSINIPLIYLLGERIFTKRWMENYSKEITSCKAFSMKRYLFLNIAITALGVSILLFSILIVIGIQNISLFYAGSLFVFSALTFINCLERTFLCIYLDKIIQESDATK